MRKICRSQDANSIEGGSSAARRAQTDLQMGEGPELLDRWARERAAPPEPPEFTWPPSGAI